MRIGKARAAGIELALAIADKRAQVCLAAAAEWKTKYDKGECDLLSFSTENAAYLEASLIAESIRSLLTKTAEQREELRRRKTA